MHIFLRRRFETDVKSTVAFPAVPVSPGQPNAREASE